MSQGHYVVAGATGHVGSVVADALLSQKKPVTVLVRDAAKGEPWKKKGAELAVGSLDRPDALTAALKGAKAFFVLLPPHYPPPDVFAHQKKVSDAIAGAVKSSGVPYVVLLSSVGADLAEGTGPVKGLHYLEEALRKTGAALAALRAGYFQENAGNSLTPAKLLGIVPNFMASADAKLPMIATKDIGRLAAELMAVDPPKSQIVDLQGPAYSMKQVAELLGKALGKPLKLVDIPQAGWVDAMTKAGIPKYLADCFAEMYGAFLKGVMKPKGDRLVQGKTPLEETIKAVAKG